VSLPHCLSSLSALGLCLCVDNWGFGGWREFWLLIGLGGGLAMEEFETEYGSLEFWEDDGIDLGSVHMAY